MLFFAKTLAIFFISAAIWTTGEIISAVNVGIYISNHSPVTHRGRFNSIIGIIRESGRSVAPYIMGLFLIDHSKQDAWLLTFIVSIILIGMLYLLYQSEKKKKETNEGV